MAFQSSRIRLSCRIRSFYSFLWRCGHPLRNLGPDIFHYLQQILHHLIPLLAPRLLDGLHLLLRIFGRSFFSFLVSARMLIPAAGKREVEN